MTNFSMGTIAILGMCAAVLLVGVIRKKTEWMLNLLMRSILGTVAIYFINHVLSGVGIALGVGINPITVLTSGILGIPGLIALYSIGIYKFL